MSQTYDFSTLQKEPEDLQVNHVRSKSGQKYFCRLCGRYDIKLPKAHLRDKHGADYRRTQNKAYGDIIECLFTRCQ